MNKVITVSVGLLILLLAVLANHFIKSSESSGNDVVVNTSESIDNTSVGRIRDDYSQGQVDAGESLDVNSTAADQPDASISENVDPATVLVDENFLELSDRLIFHSNNAINNPESRAYLQNALDQFVIANDLTGGVYVEYNECNQSICILSVEIVNGMVSQEGFEMLEQELLFGEASEVTSVGGSYAVIEGDDKKSLRLFYDLEG